MASNICGYVERPIRIWVMNVTEGILIDARVENVDAKDERPSGECLGRAVLSASEAELLAHTLEFGGKAKLITENIGLGAWGDRLVLVLREVESEEMYLDSFRRGALVRALKDAVRNARGGME